MYDTPHRSSVPNLVCVSCLILLDTKDAKRLPCCFQGPRGARWRRQKTRQTREGPVLRQASPSVPHHDHAEHIAPPTSGPLQYIATDVRITCMFARHTPQRRRQLSSGSLLCLAGLQARAWSDTNQLPDARDGRRNVRGVEGLRHRRLHEGRVDVPALRRFRTAEKERKGGSGGGDGDGEESTQHTSFKR